MLTFKDNNIENILSCPICKAPMQVYYDGSGCLSCIGTRRHCYDFAAGGYVNLGLPGQSGGGDSKQAVRARSDFLNLGHYKPISDALCEILCRNLDPANSPVVIDAGCGEGYYTNAVAMRGFSTAGFDLSKFAADSAAKRAKREGINNAFFGVASVFSLPVRDESADAVINVFAPCAEQEYSRVLKSGGLLVVVCAGPNHLLGLKRAIYDEIHRNDQRADMPVYMQRISTERLEYTVRVDGNDNIKNLFAMTPYYWKTSPDDVLKLDKIDSLTTEIDIIFELYKKI
ncbi:MAG: methyltransferase domain-containing protein [Clostridia bacterium]|nr:methyltransferase domain-containing protein [Clostridia bacterium]